MSVKKLLGIEADYTHFDTDIIIHINSVFAILAQIGVGPVVGFSISDDTATWADFAPADEATVWMVKSYIYMKVKLMFDPPVNSAVIESMNKMISEFEWRAQAAVE